MTREALDHIFAAIPALRQLQDSLSGSTPSSGPSEVSSGISGPLFNAVNPVATRPAAAWAEVIGLGTVSEATEFGGSEDGDERNTRRRSRG